MSPKFTPPPSDPPELAKLLILAVESYEAMTADRQREMHLAQRKSWVVGEMMLEHPEMTRDEATSIYDRVCP